MQGSLEIGSSEEIACLGLQLQASHREVCPTNKLLGGALSHLQIIGAMPIHIQEWYFGSATSGACPVVSCPRIPIIYTIIL